MGKPRSIASASISFGLVAIPIKLYTATDSDKVSFNFINPKTGNRVKQLLRDEVTEEIIENRSELQSGYEVAKGQYVVFSKEELKALESPKTFAFEIKEFVPLSSVDLCQIEKTYYISPDKGGDKAYSMLSAAMDAEKKAAVGMWTNKGKDNLVLIRSHKGGLILHILFYANEVRNFDEVNQCAKMNISDAELDMAKKLIKQLSSKSFDATPYHDGYRERVKEAVEQKLAGKEVTVQAEAPKANVLDLFEALKASLKG
jgi:DNA end-binding protein Ku